MSAILTSYRRVKKISCGSIVLYPLDTALKHSSQIRDSPFITASNLPTSSLTITDSDLFLRSLSLLSIRRVEIQCRIIHHLLTKAHRRLNPAVQSCPKFTRRIFTALIAGTLPSPHIPNRWRTTSLNMDTTSLVKAAQNGDLNAVQSIPQRWSSDDIDVDERDEVSSFLVRKCFQCLYLLTEYCDRMGGRR